MRAIDTLEEYKAVTSRIEELLAVVGNETPVNNKEFIELDLLSDMVADYEETYKPLRIPTLPEVIKLRMFEMGLNQKQLSELLDVSTSRVSEYLTGKSEPTLKVARTISKKLSIDPSIVLGV
jgi:HTH-type transcriptional regulator / antitoxin HigA